VSRILVILIMMAGSAAFADPLPVPPLPPDNPPLEQSAPVPNPDARAPLIPTSEHAQVAVGFYRFNPPNPSMGFAPGSRYQTSEDRKPIQTPGFSVSVPVQ
jgi:hypothetical protein